MLYTFNNSLWRFVIAVSQNKCLFEEFPVRGFPLLQDCPTPTSHRDINVEFFQPHLILHLLRPCKGPSIKKAHYVKYVSRSCRYFFFVMACALEAFEPRVKSMRRTCHDTKPTEERISSPCAGSSLYNSFPAVCCIVWCLRIGTSLSCDAGKCAYLCARYLRIVWVVADCSVLLVLQ